jgi:hypothetical protein
MKKRNHRINLNYITPPSCTFDFTISQFFRHMVIQWWKLDWGGGGGGGGGGESVAWSRGLGPVVRRLDSTIQVQFSTFLKLFVDWYNPEIMN